MANSIATNAKQQERGLGSSESMKPLPVTTLLLITGEETFAGGGGSGSSRQDGLLLWIPLLLLLLLWGSPKLYSFLKTKFKKQIPEEDKQE
ncbi:MAG: hypothetical protein JJE25_10670 [Bacteroidia bacterium]|nr:hypothetical protein [Bacteroidia bacterium]